MFKRLFNRRTELARVTARVDDSPGWGGLSGRPHEYDPAKVQEIYADSLEAWRKNPIAWRIIAITTDYVVGDTIALASPRPRLNRFISEFWHNPKNRMDLRLETMCDELARAGDLFVLLFRNSQDGMSYIRLVTKDRILRIETAANDWETELAYVEIPNYPVPAALPLSNSPHRSTDGGRVDPSLASPFQKADGGREAGVWLSPYHPDAAQAPAIMLHYAINRPAGALLGEGDLTTMLPWLLRYSRMLEDRVRLHWAVRAFLWMVTVPPNKVREKQEQYRRPPESGSIIIKDESETWSAVTPQLNSADARHDLQAVRGMIDAGSGYPPHWRGEAADANLATATAMQAPTERHLLRRQQYFSFILMDILFQAYQRAVQVGRARPLGSTDYATLFTVNVPDVSRSDNEALARSARDLAQGLATLQGLLPGRSPSLAQRMLKLFMKFAGEPLGEAQVDEIMREVNGDS